MRALVHHLVICGFWLAMLLVGAHAVGLRGDGPVLAVLAVLATGGALFLSVFALFHDAAHSSLGLSRRHNDALLLATGWFLLYSAHAQRSLHLRHHARPLAPDDVEGIGAGASFFGALRACVTVAPRMHVEGARGASPRIAHWIAAEHAFTAVIVGLATVFPTSALGIYVGLALVLQSTMSLWASHVPHHPPAWLVKLGRPLLWTRSPVLSSAILHREHHDHPRIPGRALYSVAV